MNDLKQVEREAKALMTAHGVGHVPFRFSKATRAIAAVHLISTASATGVVRLPTQLSFSRRWAMVMPPSDLHEIMIHEIAHIHTLDAERPHGPEFQAAVRALGGRATRRCFSPSVNLDGTPRKMVG